VVALEKKNKVEFHEVGCGGIDWVDLALNRDGWRAVVNAVMNFRVPKNAVNY
jgi:hypothetical protein